MNDYAVFYDDAQERFYAMSIHRATRLQTEGEGTVHASGLSFNAAKQTAKELNENE